MDAAGIPRTVIPFQPSVAFNIEITNFFCRAKQKTNFYMKRNTGLKWVNMCLTDIQWLQQTLPVSKDLICFKDTPHVTKAVIISGRDDLGSEGQQIRNEEQGNFDVSCESKFSPCNVGILNNKCFCKIGQKQLMKCCFLIIIPSLDTGNPFLVKTNPLENFHNCFFHSEDRRAEPPTPHSPFLILFLVWEVVNLPVLDNF